jgi:8-oxo-dGTP pyrophosphatase MutT (NUDIX family)
MHSDRPAPGARLHDGPPSTPRQSATVIVVRDGERGFEVLLVLRGPQQRFMGGIWVFPGGAVDADDGEGGAGHRAAAVRELREEAGIDGVRPSELVPYSRWITPELIATRFDTHFFVVRLPAGAQAAADGVECVEERWITPADALEAHAAGELPLVFPTFKHLQELAAYETVDELLTHARGRPIDPILPRVVQDDQGTRVLLPGEPGYGGG